MVAIEYRQHQGFNTAATGQNMGRIRGDHRVDELGHVELAQDSQNQW
jgi:hypothetical protein